MPPSEEKILSFSNLAASKVREYLQQSGRPDSTIRLSLVRTHCMGGRGYSYTVDEDSLGEGDVLVEDKGVKVLVKADLSQYLKGTEIDYMDAIQGGGLVVNNPNALGKCPCGHHDILG